MADSDKANLYRAPLLVGLALFCAASNWAFAFGRSAVVILGLEHPAATGAGVPEREAQEGKLQPEIDCVPGAAALDLPEIRRLNEEVDSKPPC